jgi:flavin-dependent thymidylate synthase
MGERLERGPGNSIQRYADSAMYRSEPMPAAVKEGGVQVTLLNATPDPLGSLAALYGIYDGRPVRSLSEVTDDQRREAYADIQKTALQGPLEVASFHFFIEGVTRSFTHQMVRTREAFFAQESMRFAVVDGEDWQDRAAMPPTIAAADSRTQEVWWAAMAEAQSSYDRLIDRGIPAEDARGVMPHDITTRIHMVLNLRTLLHQAGLRLCTQAQFEWRAVMAGMVNALRQHGIRRLGPDQLCAFDNWQFSLIADSLKPVCYQTGNCGFMAKFDRGCTIRKRVERFAANDVPSSNWDSEGQWDVAANAETIEHELIPLTPIHPSEWAADPYAARGNNG